MEIILSNKELENIIKGYYFEKRGLNVQVKIEDFKCSADYWDEANSQISKKALVTQNVKMFGLQKVACEELRYSDIERILKELIASEYEVDSLVCLSDNLKVIYKEKGKKRIRGL